MTPLPIQPLTAPPNAVIDLPGSKSITNRALVTAALATGETTLSRVLFAEDTRAMLDSLARLGVAMDMDEIGRTVTLQGTGGKLAPGPLELNVRQSGTTARFVLALTALGSGEYVVDGDDQMRARPMGDLLRALSSLGTEATATDNCLPATVHAAGLRGGEVAVPGSVSSQFITALLLCGPAMQNGLRLSIAGELISRPYVDMTVQVMRSFGAKIDAAADGSGFSVQPTGYMGRVYEIEPDASAASYFFAAAAASKGSVTVPGLGSDSLQGDVGFVDVLNDMGAVVDKRGDQITVTGTETFNGVSVDLADISDTAPTLGAIAAVAASPTNATGIGFIRKKESDRIAATVDGLQALGISASNDPDGWTVKPGKVTAGTIETHDDHRNAMSFAVLGLLAKGVTIDDPTCVSKTFPTFFDTLDELRRAGDASLALVALDGPSGSGKSTVARMVAEALGVQYLDTGAMYRSVTWAVLKQGVLPGNIPVVADLARALTIDVQLEKVFVDGHDVTKPIRGIEVTSNVSEVAANPEVRANMRTRQRQWARERGGGVMEGRDIGTVVFPNARVKAYIDATAEERARRRAEQSGTDYTTELAAIQARDLLDSSRVDSPLTEAADAMIIDSTDLTIEQVVDRIVQAASP